MYLDVITETKTFDNVWEAIIYIIIEPHTIYAIVFIAIVIFGLYAGKHPKLKPIALVLMLLLFIMHYFF